MKKYLLLLLLITSLKLVFSQEYYYDLIVKTNGDSLACNIDSVTDTHIYFEMKFNDKWIHTYKRKNEIAEFKQNAFDTNTIHLKPGSSYILHSDQLPSRPENNLNLGIFGDFSFISIQYERLFFINSTFFLSGKLGFGYNQEFQIISTQAPKEYFTYSCHITYNLNLKKEKYFLVLGLGGTIINAYPNYLYPIIGFRMQPLEFYKINFSPYIFIPISSFEVLLDSDFIIAPIPFGIGINAGISL